MITDEFGVKKAPKKHKSFSIKTVVTSVIIVVVLFLVLNILFFAYQGNKYATFKITENLMYQIFSTSSQRLNSYFESSYQSLLDLDYIIKEEEFDLQNNPRKFLEKLRRVLLINKSITGAYLGDGGGNFYMAKRMPDGSISYRLIRRTSEEVIVQWEHVNETYERDFPSGKFSLNEGYDPRKRPWYIKARATGNISWTDPYIFASDKKLGVSVTKPINDNGVNGVIALDFGLADVNSFLQSLPISSVGTIILFDRSDKILAYSSPAIQLDKHFKEVRREDNSKSIEILAIEDINDPVLNQLYSQYRGRNLGIEQSSLYDNVLFTSILNLYLNMFVQTMGENSLSQDISVAYNKLEEGHQTYYDFVDYSGGIYPEDGYLFMLNEFKVASDISSKLGIIIPQSAVISYFYYTFQMILLTTVVFVIISLLVIIILLNQNISKPIFVLSKRMIEMVNDFRLEPIQKKDSLLKEIQYMSTSIERVRSALVSFKRYLPQEVVANLIKSGEEAIVGGEKKEITIFFSDIKDFTKISEENPADVLLKKLESYFTIINKAITQNNGVLDKYVGDAVMAMWGVPNALPNHAVSACLAAIQIVEDLEKLNKQFDDDEFPRFFTRIGIHSGMVLVGNIGSAERLNYTCIGDSVNLASRLEGLNKFYRTQLLVSNMALHQAKDFVESRLIDRVTVKGRTQKILVHEVIARKGELYGKEWEFLREYKKAIRFYFEGYIEDAYKSFVVANRLKPDDFVTQLYLKKARHFKDQALADLGIEQMTLDRRGI